MNVFDVFNVKMVPGEEMKHTFAVIPLKSGVYEDSFVSVELSDLGVQIGENASGKYILVRDSECFV